jgi:hypothetical protein
MKEQRITSYLKPTTLSVTRVNWHRYYNSLIVKTCNNVDSKLLSNAISVKIQQGAKSGVFPKNYAGNVQNDRKIYTDSKILKINT